MHTFALEEWTPARIESVTPRLEMHGKNPVVAVSIGFKIQCANTLFDVLSPSLRDGLYRRAEDQPDLPGVEAVTPHLRAPDIAGAKIALDKVKPIEGATVYLDWGADGEDEPIVLGTSKVDRFAAVPFEGGSGEIYLRAGSSDVDDTELGHICGKLGQEIRIRIEPPRKVEPEDLDDDQQLTLDGTTGAEIGERSDAWDTAEAVFARQHGGDAEKGGGE
ncbi:MAG TPA: hypothetical protein VF457_07250 [Burkholderiaceae bacterium]